jgi:hypothetical protein
VPQDSPPALHLLLRFRREMALLRPVLPERSPSARLRMLTWELLLTMQEELELTSAHHPPTSPELPRGMF